MRAGGPVGPRNPPEAGAECRWDARERTASDGWSVGWLSEAPRWAITGWPSTPAQGGAGFQNAARQPLVREAAQPNRRAGEDVLGRWGTARLSNT